MKLLNLFKILCFVMLAGLLIFMGACKKNDQVTPEPPADDIDPAPQKQERDVDYPTEINYLDEDAIMIHYYRKDGKYAKWCLWLWDPAGDDDSLEDVFNYQDDFGVIAYYPLSKFGSLSGNKLGIIIKVHDTWTKDGTESDRFIDFSVLEKDEKGIYHAYFFGGDGGVYSNAEKKIPDAITSAAFTNTKQLVVQCATMVDSYEVYADGVLVEKVSDVNRLKFTYNLATDLDFSKVYSVKVIFKASGQSIETNVSLSALYNTDAYNAAYYYDGDLGAIYTQAKTEFKVWSPISTDIKLRIYDNGTPTSVDKAIGDDTYQEYTMVKGEKGVFSYTIEGDLNGKYYTYNVFNAYHQSGAEICDPYAKAAGVNGIRGMIVNFNTTDPAGWDEVAPLAYDRKELVVWETHVADVTSHDTWTGSAANKRKYLGLIEEGTTYKSGPYTVTTGFDHIKELGVNAVQLIPVFDQANDETKYVFNWGYNPLNYNVVEGMYSLDPYHGEVRITELKQVIQAFNEAGISVIMDVVYNHVNGVTNSNFDVLMPYYYFRYNDDGTLSNGSGCGNEVASENAMMRKFIIDSTKFWTEEYKLGGFRFDLMGLIDMDTMNELTVECTKINPNMVIYGEPWQGGTSPLLSTKAATQANGYKYEGYGQFNDQTRDALVKSGMNDDASRGWVNTSTTAFASDVQKIVYGINGGTYLSRNPITDPNKNVIYATCHDNYTLYDRMKAAGITDNQVIEKMAMLANAVVFTSNGTTFMLAGEEMLRTKQGDKNSYKSSDDINALNYAWKISHAAMFERYKTLINFKKTVTGLHLDNPQIEVEQLASGSVLKYTVTDTDYNYLVIHANGLGANQKISVSGTIYIDTLGTYSGEVSEVITAAYQTIIVKMSK